MVEMVTWLQSRIHSLRASGDRGAAAVEYGLLVGLIAVAIIITVTALGNRIDSLFQQVCDALPGTGAC